MLSDPLPARRTSRKGRRTLTLTLTLTLTGQEDLEEAEARDALRHYKHVLRAVQR